MPTRSLPGLPRTAITLRHQDGSGKYATGATKDNKDKISARCNNLVFGTWNVRTLNTPGKLEELTLNRYKWNVLGLCEIRWKGMGKTTIHEGHKIYFSGRDDRYKEGVGFLVHKNTISAVMGCRPVFSRLITIRLRASPFNFTIVQLYEPTTIPSVEEIKDFYQQIQEVVLETPKEDISVVQGDWNAKIGENAQKD